MKKATRTSATTANIKSCDCGCGMRYKLCEKCCCAEHIDNVQEFLIRQIAPPYGHGAAFTADEDGETEFDHFICPGCPVHGDKEEAGEK